MICLPVEEVSRSVTQKSRVSLISFNALVTNLHFQRKISSQNGGNPKQDRHGYNLVPPRARFVIVQPLQHLIAESSPKV